MLIYMTMGYLQRMMEKYLESSESSTQIEVGDQNGGTIPLMTIERGVQLVVLEGFVDYLMEQMGDEKKIDIRLNVPKLPKNQLN